jgi:excisionase family DNA binding protein
MERLLDIDDLSDKLRVKKSTIYSWTSRKRIPHIKLGRRILKFRESEIDSRLEKSSSRPEAGERKAQRRAWKGKGPGKPLESDDIERIVREPRKEVL